MTTKSVTITKTMTMSGLIIICEYKSKNNNTNNNKNNNNKNNRNKGNFTNRYFKKKNCTNHSAVLEI